MIDIWLLDRITPQDRLSANRAVEVPYNHRINGTAPRAGVREPLRLAPGPCLC